MIGLRIRQTHTERFPLQGTDMQKVKQDLSLVIWTPHLVLHGGDSCLFVCLCVFVWTCVWQCVPMEIRGHFAGIILLLFIVRSGDETWVLWLGGKRLYLGAISPAHTHEVLLFPASLETVNRCLALCAVTRCTTDDVGHFPIFFLVSIFWE